MPVCSFCRRAYEWPRGMTIVQKDGSVKFLCSRKCKRYSEMGKDNKKLKWVRKNAQEASDAKVKKE
jgi:large subunit ribosomal protein L24e